MKKQKPQVLFADLKEENQPTVIQSVCVECQDNGVTTMLLIKIPFFREIILFSFNCDHCGYRNNEVQFAGKLQDYGVQILFRVMNKLDFNREIIKSEHATIYFKEVDLEIPVNGKGQISTIQGLLLRTYDELKFHQPIRKINQPQTYEKLQKFLEKVKLYLDGQTFPLTINIKDPSGNSTIKNPNFPAIDKNMQITHTVRTLEQLKKMGYSIENVIEKQKIEAKTNGNKINFAKPFQENNFLQQQPSIINIPCHVCNLDGEMKICQVSVPYFTDIVIMSFTCEYCGAHTVQTKIIEPLKDEACVITLKTEGDIDLKRDVLKSDTCAVNFPEIQLELQYGTLGGVFTTVQGLIEKIYDNFSENNNFVDSDSQFSSRIKVLLNDLMDMRMGKRPFIMQLIDPLSKSFISNPFKPDPDPRVKIEFRPRTFEENEDLGYNDIKVENYINAKEYNQ